MAVRWPGSQVTAFWLQDPRQIPAKVGATTEAACRLNTIFLQLFALENKMNKMLFGFV